jgi:hypothetical protein
MSFAAARVDVKIGLHGEGDAAKSVADVRNGLDKLGGTASKAGAASAGLAAVLGGAVPEVAKLGQSFTAAGAAASLIPGPLGLAVAAVAAAAIGAYELNKNLSETAAKVQNLGNAATEALADRLDLSVDATIRLQQALEDIPLKLRPTTALLDVVRQRAESMGQDGGEAVAKFTAALGRGPEALRDFERQFGRLASAVDSLPDVAARLGLSQAALGIAQGVGNEAERAKKAAQQAVALERQHQALLEGAAKLAEQATKARVVQSLELNRQSASMQLQAVLAGELVRAATAEANELQAVVDKQRAATEAAQGRTQAAQLASARIAVLEAEAGVQLDKQEQTRAVILTLGLRATEVTRKIKELEDANRAGLVKEVDYRLQLAGLKVEGLGIAAKELALGKQAASDLQTRRQRGQQAHDAEVAAQIRLSRVQAQAAEGSITTLGQVHRLKLRQLQLEEAAELAKSRRATNTVAGHEADKLAIRAEFLAKRQALLDAENKAEQDAANENGKILGDSMQRSADLAVRTADVVAQGAARRMTGLAAVLRSSGQDEQADLVERRQAWADYQGQLVQMDRELAAQRDLTAAGSEDRANVERQSLEAQAQAYEAYSERLNLVDQRRNQRLKESVNTALDAIRAPAELLTSAGGPSAKLGKALDATANGVRQVSANWKGMKASAPDAISAVGVVASAFVNNERRKAAVLAVTEAAAAVASLAGQNYVAAAGHGVAAALYGSVAAGVLGGSSAPAAGAAPSGPPASDRAGAGGAGGGQGGGGGQVVNVYFSKGFVVGSPQQVGVAVQGAVGSLQGTGLKAKGV